jgi:hypothetical protein
MKESRPSPRRELVHRSKKFWPVAGLLLAASPVALAAELRVDLAPPGQPQLSWTNAAPGYVLETSATLQPPAWVALAEPDASSTTNGEVLTVTDHRAGLAARFYRLRAKEVTPPTGALAYDIGSPAFQDRFVDPVNGSDDNDGHDRAHAFQSLRSAWLSLPEGTLPAAVRLRLLPGSYREAYLEGRHGTYEHPILIEPAEGPGTVTFEPLGDAGGGLQFFDASFVYLQDFRVRVEGGDALHFDRCDHVLVRRMRVSTVRSEGQDETFKVNQSQYVYLEDSDISDAGDNCVDMVAVQHGHIVRNKLHNSQDWVMYLKGGSAYLVVEGNEIYGGGTGGFTAGQGSGLQFMVPPWIHYEAYDIKVRNNLIHDCDGAGLGVNGGYNILYAHNTLYRVGARSHTIEVVHGSRSCDGNDAGACQPLIDLGGWGTTDEGGQFIPNRHVAIVNNVICNPADFTNGGQFLNVFAPVVPPAGSNIPNPSRADDDLMIRGNVFWSLPLDTPLGIGEDSGCQDGTCTDTQLRAENRFNTLEPDFVDAPTGDFRPRPGGALATVAGVATDDFAWSDAPARPAVPPGNPNNAVLHDQRGTVRPPHSPPGALLP